MSNDWQTDKEITDKYLPQIKQIIGETFLDAGGGKEEQQENTDLILRMDTLRVACRVRDYKYLERYGGEFTIRSKRQGGIDTELKKCVNGSYGNAIFYAFADENRQHLIHWTIGDLKVFRDWFIRELIKLNKGEIPGQEFSNADGSSKFRVYKWGQIPNIIISSSEQH